MSDYFVIYLDEDGKNHITQMSRRELEDCLNNKNWGDNPNIFERVPNVGYAHGLLIIKGEVVVPRAVKVVEKIELP